MSARPDIDKRLYPLSHAQRVQDLVDRVVDLLRPGLLLVLLVGFDPRFDDCPFRWDAKP